MAEDWARELWLTGGDLWPALAVAGLTVVLDWFARSRLAPAGRLRVPFTSLVANVAVPFWAILDLRRLNEFVTRSDKIDYTPMVQRMLISALVSAGIGFTIALALQMSRGLSSKRAKERLSLLRPMWTFDTRDLLLVPSILSIHLLSLLFLRF